MKHIGSVRSITRFPVKSMAGEALPAVELTPTGLLGDRTYAFESSNAPAGMHRLTGQQRRNMLLFHAHTRADGSVCVTTPSGQSFDVTSPELLQHFDHPGAYRLTTSDSPQTDVRPVSIHAIDDLAGLSKEFGAEIDPRRFRSNLVFELSVTLTGGYLIRVGPSAVLEILEPIPRCRFITYDPAEPVGADPLFGLMRFLERTRKGCLGVYARVKTPGHIRLGDAVSLLPGDASNTP